MWWKAVAYPGDVLHIDGRVADRLNRYAIQVVNRLRCGIRDVDVVFFAANFRRAGREDQVLHHNGIHYIQSRKSFGFECRRVEVDLHLTSFPPYGAGTDVPGIVISCVRMKFSR